MKKVLIGATSLFVSGLFLFASSVSAQQAAGYYGEYDESTITSGVPAGSLKGPKVEDWPTLDKAKKKYKIPILVPQLVDTWAAFSYGAVSEGERLGVEPQLFDAGGYLNLGKQKKQLATLKGVDAVIFSSINYKKMDSTVKKLHDSGIPVIALANDIHAPAISGKSMVSFVDMGKTIGDFVIKDSAGAAAKVAFFPGPKGAGWSDDSLKGFLAKLDENPDAKAKITVIDSWGDTREKMQARLVDTVLKKNSDVTYIIGNAVAANYAASLGNSKLKVVSTYINPGVYQSIKDKKIMAAACDFPVLQGKFAMDMAVRILEGEKAGEGKLPFRVGPVIQTVTQDNIGDFPYEKVFGMRGYTPKAQ